VIQEARAHAADKERSHAHIIELRAQTGVVFLTYKGVGRNRRLCRAVTADAPIYDFRADDAVHHTGVEVGARQATELWMPSRASRAVHCGSAPSRGGAPPAPGGDADGGDSSEADASSRWRSDKEVHILAYNRTVKDLAGQGSATVLAALRRRVPVRDGSPKPRGKGEVAMSSTASGTHSTVAGLRRRTSRARAARRRAPCKHHVLEPLLKIGDVRTDKRIDFSAARAARRRLRQRPRRATPRSPSRCIPSRSTT